MFLCGATQLSYRFEEFWLGLNEADILHWLFFKLSEIGKQKQLLQSYTFKIIL